MVQPGVERLPDDLERLRVRRSGQRGHPAQESLDTRHPTVQQVRPTLQLNLQEQILDLIYISVGKQIRNVCSNFHQGISLNQDIQKMIMSFVLALMRDLTGHFKRMLLPPLTGPCCMFLQGYSSQLVRLTSLGSHLMTKVVT